MAQRISSRANEWLRSESKKKRSLFAQTEGASVWGWGLDILEGEG